MTIKELITELEKCQNKDRTVVISRLSTPFNVTQIKEIMDNKEGPVYIRGLSK